MIDVEHHETIQMTVLQTTMTEGLPLGGISGVKFIAAEDECWQILLEILCVCFQLFGIRLLRPGLTGSCLLQVPLLQIELLIFRAAEP